VTFNFNTELYAHPDLTEGVDWARRFRRHDRFDDSLTRTGEPPRTVILAPHGGGIEPGTSELCLAVAGHHPTNLPITPPAGVTHDYWMFEGVREAGNAALHVKSTGCDDVVAVSLCAGALSALSLHGFDPAKSQLPPDKQLVLVGGGDELLRGLLLQALDNVDLPVEDAGGHGELDGNNRCNIVNRTLRGKGAQLEISEPLRETMFGDNSRPGRKHTTTQVFWTFVAACRDALDRLEAEPDVADPDLRFSVRPDGRCPDS
jgi:phage replication-related protein YjqB (UPF0714/DUF867 family)